MADTPVQAAIRRAMEAVQDALNTLGEAFEAAAPAPTPPTPQPPSTVTGPVRSFWLNLNGHKATDEVLKREALRRTYVILNAWDHEMAKKLKSYNPALKVLCYKDASSTRSTDSNPNDALLPAGVSYYRAAGPWFLMAAGRAQRLTYSGYTGHYQMNVGNRAYQDAWITNVSAMFAMYPVWDGIWLDNLLWNPDDYHSGIYPEGYPTAESFQVAYDAFLLQVTSRLPEGKLVVGNLANARMGQGRWGRYMRYLDGGFDEWWLTFSDTNLLPEYAEGWSRVVNEVADTDAQGKFAVVQPHFTNTTAGRKAQLYSLASFYLAITNDSRSAYGYVPAVDAYGAPYEPFAEMTWDLGRPIAAAAPTSGVAGEWTRRFERGFVKVNTKSCTGEITRS